MQTNYIPRPDKIIKELKCSDENSLHWTPSSEFGVQPVSGKCVIIPPLPKTRSFPDKHQGTSDSRSAKNVKNTLSADTPLPFLDTQHAGGFHLNCGGATDDWYRGPNNTAGYSDNIYGEIYLQSDAGKCPTGSSPNCFKKALNISDQWCDGKKLDSTSSDAHSEGMYKSVQYYTNNTLKDYCANWYLFDPENKYKIHVPLQKQEDIDKAQVVTGQPAVSQGAGAKPDQPWGWNDDFHCGEGGEEIMSDCAWFNLGCEWHKCLPDGTCDPPPAPS